VDKITSCCNICKYTVTNKLTTISFHKPSYINYTVLLVSCTILAHKASCTAVHTAAVPSYMLLCSCILYFSSRLDFSIETTVMVTSLLVSIHHAVTALILNLTTVGTEALTSRPGRFTPGKYTGIYRAGYRLDARNLVHVLEQRKSAYIFRICNINSSTIQPTDWSLCVCY